MPLFLLSFFLSVLLYHTSHSFSALLVSHFLASNFFLCIFQSVVPCIFSQLFFFQFYILNLSLSNLHSIQISALFFVMFCSNLRLFNPLKVIVRISHRRKAQLNCKFDQLSIGGGGGTKKVNSSVKSELKGCLDRIQFDFFKSVKHAIDDAMAIKAV